MKIFEIPVRISAASLVIAAIVFLTIFSSGSHAASASKSKVAVSNGFDFAAPKIAGLKIGKDKDCTQETDTFGAKETVYAAARISNVSEPVKVKAQLTVEDIPGQQPGPIKGLEATVNIGRNGTANFNFSAPTKGWPKGKYGLEVVVLNEHDEEMDHHGAEFTVE